MDMSLGKFQKLVMDREMWRAGVHGVAKSRTRLDNWTELNLGFESVPHRVSLVAQLVKNLLVMKETPVWSLGQEDPLEEG